MCERPPAASRPSPFARGTNFLPLAEGGEPPPKGEPDRAKHQEKAAGGRLRDRFRSITHRGTERLDNCGIKLRLFTPDNLVDSLFLASALSIGPVRRESIEGIADSNNARPQWNLM